MRHSCILLLSFLHPRAVSFCDTPSLHSGEQIPKFKMIFFLLILFLRSPAFPIRYDYSGFIFKFSPISFYRLSINEFAPSSDSAISSLFFRPQAPKINSCFRIWVVRVSSHLRSHFAVASLFRRRIIKTNHYSPPRKEACIRIRSSHHPNPLRRIFFHPKT